MATMLTHLISCRKTETLILFWCFLWVLLLSRSAIAVREAGDGGDMTMKLENGNWELETETGTGEPGTEKGSSEIIELKLELGKWKTVI